MFLRELDEEQRETFLILAHRLAAIDGEDSPEEERMLQELRAEMDIDSTIDMSRVVAQELDVGAFDSHRVRVIAALELLLLAYADEYVHEAEVQLVTDVCFAMGFNEEWLAVMGEWATRFHDLTDEDPEDEAWRAYHDALIQHAEAMMNAA